MPTLTTDDRLRLHVQRWPAREPALGTVQIVHGLGEHIGRYEHVAAALNAAGWHVLGHDQRGHGRSEGPRGTLTHPHALLIDLTQVIDAFRGPGLHVLLGHSMGGMVAARYVAEGLLPAPERWLREVDALVLSSPALELGLGRAQRALLAVLGTLAPRLRLGNGLDPAWVSRDAQVVAAYRADPLVHDRVTAGLVRFMADGAALVRSLAPAWRVPTLLMWAGADRCVRPSGSEAFAAAAPQSVVGTHAWGGLAHEIFNEPERAEVLAELVRWLGGFAASSPPAVPLRRPA